MPLISDIINDISLLTRKKTIYQSSSFRFYKHLTEQLWVQLQKQNHTKGSEKHFFWSLPDNLHAHLDTFRLVRPFSLAIYLPYNISPAVEHSPAAPWPRKHSVRRGPNTPQTAERTKAWCRQATAWQGRKIKLSSQNRQQTGSKQTMRHSGDGKAQNF